MKIKAGMRNLGVALLAAVLALGSPIAAHASTGGGIGGGSGGGTATNGFQWRAAAGAKGYGYQQFVAQAGAPKTWIDKELNARVKGGAKVCQESTAVWWVHSTSTNAWVPNYRGKTHGSGWAGSGTIEKPKNSYGRGPAAEEVADFKLWDKTKNGTKIDGKPGYTIICSNRPIADLKRSINETDKKTASGSYENTSTYSYMATVAPMRLANGSWAAQPANVVKTNFGKLYDSLVADSKKNKLYSPAEVESKVKAALAKDAKGNFSAQVALSPANQQTFSKGGVLNISEFSTKAKVSVSKTDTETKTRTCNYVRKWNPVKGFFDAEVSTGCTAWKTTSVIAGKPSFSTATQTAQNTGFWQMIATHCNEPEFTALANATGATVLNSGDASKNLSAVAQSKKYASQPSMLDFGNSRHSNAAAAKSGTDGFYDKECGFVCVASPDTAQGASASNGAITNKGTAKQNAGTQSENRQGAVSGTSNTNSMEFFRDNAPKKITVDVWYPKSSGVVDYKSNPTAAITTSVSRWAEGTPSISGAGGGKFIMKAGNKTLFTGSGSAPSQRNWNTNEFSNSTVTALNGLVRDFTVQGSWASEKGKPQVVNVKWEYAPNVSTTFPTSLGFSRTGAAASTLAKSANKAVAAPIQGKCYANFGETASKSTVESFQKNTGTGSTNGLDGVVSVGSRPSDASTNLVFNFVRATTE